MSIGFAYVWFYKGCNFKNSRRALEWSREVQSRDVDLTFVYSALERSCDVRLCVLDLLFVHGALEWSHDVRARDLDTALWNGLVIYTLQSRYR